MERMEQLSGCGYRYYYDDALFKPGTDAFLLAAFARPRARDRVCDLGAGTGLIGLVLLTRESSLELRNVELQESPLRLAERTARENALSVCQHLCDLRSLEGVLEAGSFDYVVSNPPYFSSGSGCTAPDPARRIARQESCCTLEEVCAAAARLLRWGGRFALVHRPDRLCDLMTALRRSGLEPKRMRLVHHTTASAPSLVLLEGRRGGRPTLKVEPPLILRDEKGQETPEVQASYFRMMKH